MGRIKTQLVKRFALKMINEYPDTFKKNFSENKTLLTEIADVPSKKLRNVIAGYLSRLVKQQVRAK